MNSIKSSAKDKAAQLDVKGAKAIFENGIKRQRAPSPAPARMTARTPLAKKKSIGGSTGAAGISAFKEKFEQFTAPKPLSTPPKSNIRRAVSETNVNNEVGTEIKQKARTRSNSVAEKHWISARTKIYEQLGSEQRARSQSDIRKSFESNSAAASPVLDRRKLTNDKLTGKKDEKVESLSERINKYKTGVETTKVLSEKTAAVVDEKASAKIKDIKSTFNTKQAAPDSTEKPKHHSLADKFPLFSQQPASAHKTDDHHSNVSKVKSASKLYADPKKSIENHDKADRNHLVTCAKSEQNNKTSIESQKLDVVSPKDKSENKSIDTNNHSVKKEKKVIDIQDHDTARHFMEELIAAIDNDQHVPMKQLITMFETMKKENNNMKDSIENLKSQLDKSDIESINHSLRTKLQDTTEQLQQAQEQINELMVFREALRESEERCEELEELNHHYLEEIEELKLVMNEMRDQFHDDEVHETIILQQRLDDMARSLRIIHFRLKKADAKLQETEREKETLLEEVKLLQGGTFTDEEIRRMQSLEGDLQAAKEVSVELHNQLQRSEERREKLEKDAAQLREEIKAHEMENDRLKNNIIHLREQMKSSGLDGASLKPTMALVRQGSSADVESLKSNLEAAIERENDIKEQLLQAEEEAKMLRKRLRDIEHENDALTKQLKKLSHAAHGSKGHSSDANKTSEHIQTEVIQLENVQLTRNNDILHQDIDSLKAQIKSLQQKVALLHDEQHEGPLSMNKNSIYYETKFELMTQEIDDLRRQLQERDNDYKSLREETTGKSSKRDQFRRAISIDSDSLDTKRQLDIVQHEADILKDKLQQLEKDNDRLIKENERLQSPQNSRAHSQETVGRNDKSSLSNRLVKLEEENSRLLVQLERQATDGDREQQQKYNEIECENSRLITELSYYRKSKPDIAKLVSSLSDSEQKILTYETEIAILRGDMFKMERNLQDDINSLTMKNSLLRSLLEAINEHGENHKDGENSEQSATDLSTTSAASNHTMAEDRSNTQLTHHNDISNDSVITTHINRLPQEIQSQFRKKIECLERQLQEERERAKAAENLLQQVKLHLTSCVLLSPIAQMMQPRKVSRYPNPPPSLVIKPSANDSPSHVVSRAHRLTSSNSTPERMKMGQSLANQLYLGNLSSTTSLTNHSEDTLDDTLTVSIQQPENQMPKIAMKSLSVSEALCRKNGEAMSNNSTLSNGLLPQNKFIKSYSMDDPSYTRTVLNGSQLSPEITVTSSPTKLTSSVSESNSASPDVRPKQRVPVNHQNSHNKSYKSKKNTSLRQKFFDNYTSMLAMTYKAKKKVSFALPGNTIERDISDISISSHLSAASDCIILDDDDDE